MYSRLYNKYYIHKQTMLSSLLTYIYLLLIVFSILLSICRYNYIGTRHKHSTWINRSWLSGLSTYIICQIHSLKYIKASNIKNSQFPLMKIHDCIETGQDNTCRRAPEWKLVVSRCYSIVSIYFCALLGCRYHLVKDLRARILVPWA